MVVTESTLSTSEIFANRFGLVSRMADDIAHEIKNPLHSMAINLEVMRRRVAAGDGEAAIERADIIDAELRRVSELVDHLLRLVRPAASEGRITDLDATLGDILPLLKIQARLANLSFEYAPIGEPLLVAVGPTTLKFAVLNAAQEMLDLGRATGAGLRVSSTARPAALRIAAHLPDGAVIAAPKLDDERGARIGARFAEAMLRPAGAGVEYEHETAANIAVRITLPVASSA